MYKTAQWLLCTLVDVGERSCPTMISINFAVLRPFLVHPPLCVEVKLPNFQLTEIVQIAFMIIMISLGQNVDGWMAMPGWLGLEPEWNYRVANE